MHTYVFLVLNCTNMLIYNIIQHTFIWSYTLPTIRCHKLQSPTEEQPGGHDSASLGENMAPIIPHTTLICSKQSIFTTINVVICSLELLTRELERLHSLVTSFPLQTGTLFNKVQYYYSS